MGSKIYLITDGNGLPLSLGVSGANMHDSQGLEPLVRGIPPVRSRSGPRRRRPKKLHADKRYDYDSVAGFAGAVSATGSLAGGTSPPSGWAATAGWSREPCPGWPAAAACTAATNPKPSTSSRSLPSPQPSSGIAVSAGEPGRRADADQAPVVTGGP
ncbi:hypothetical protein GCM10018783_02510 [Streptomyces griseosporeus]|nr:hypothetical protein GCM10018783_02510 [Streptomyces griseosporeus]